MALSTILRGRWVRRVVLLVWLGSIAAVCVLSLLPKVYEPVSFWNSDKVYHMLFYGWLGFLPQLLFARHEGGKAAALAMFCLGGLLECLQIYIPGRFFSMGDIAANGVGVLIGLWVGRVVAINSSAS